MRFNSLLLLVVTCFLAWTSDFEASALEAGEIVWYLPGFLSGDTPDLIPSGVRFFISKNAMADLKGDALLTERMTQLRELYPNAESIALVRWNSPAQSVLQIGPAWEKSLEESESTAETLFEEIRNLAPESQCRLVLIGHSLGARIVVRALARCAESGIRVKKFILLGAAMDNDDPDLAAALGASLETPVSMVNMRDAALAFYCQWEGHAALGTGALAVIEPEKFLEIVSAQGTDHSPQLYLQRYAQSVNSNDFTSDEILVPQDGLNWVAETPNAGIWWETLDRSLGWELQSNNVRGTCRILNPDGVRMAWGSRVTMRKAFEKVKCQLNTTSDTQPRPITVIQHYTNANFPTTGGAVFWGALDLYNGWRLQQNPVTGHCRILDPRDVRRAWGSEEKMWESFEDVKRQLRTP